MVNEPNTRARAALDGLRALYNEIRERHHGYMPPEVRAAYDRAGEILRAASPTETEGGATS